MDGGRKDGFKLYDPGKGWVLDSATGAELIEQEPMSSGAGLKCLEREWGYCDSDGS